MALIGVNAVSANPRKPSTLEQIALGVDIAAKLLGTGLQGYKTFAIDKPANEAEIKLKTAQAQYYSSPDREADRDLDRRVKESTIKYQDAARPVELETKKIALKQAQIPKLPDHVKKSAENLADSVMKYQNASRYLENELAEFENTDIPEDVRVKIGEGMLKGLNSVLGADAVGAEEAQRLGGLLKFKKGNLTEAGSFVGRDLDLFADQIRSKIRAIQGSEKSTIDQLNRVYKQYGVSPIGPSSNPKSGNRRPGLTEEESKRLMELEKKYGPK